MHRLTRLAGALSASVLVLTACANDDSPGGSAAQGAPCEPADGPVTLNFTSWIPGIEEVVEVWNEQNPDIQVQVQTGPSGNAGTYQNFFNQLRAGEAPDLGQIEYDALPSFRVQDGLVNLAGCEAVMDSRELFVDWTWSQVSFGEEDAAFAVPQDAGPMALFYRSDLFEEHEIEVPTTWEEYAAAAEQVRAADGYITNFSQSDINQFAGLAWQNGGRWFAHDSEQWRVELTDPATVEVAEYWQDLLDRDLLATEPPWTTEWDNAYNSGQVWTWVSAVWGANSIASGAPDTEGNWAVAPMPQWNEGDAAAGNWGGSSTAVFQGSEHVYEATQFALWLNTSDEALELLIEHANLYPATIAGAELPALSEGVEFYGDQPIYDVFAEASQQVLPDFVWGPTMTQTYADASDGFRAAVSGQQTLVEALAEAEESTIDTLRSQAIPVQD